MNFTKKLTLTSLIIGSITLTGCSAMNTAVKKRNLEVSTKLSETVWLDPVSAEKRTVYVQFRDTSDKQGLVDIGKIKKAIESKGYTILDNPDKAHYWVMLNVKKVGKSDLREVEGYLSQGYGSAIVGGFIGSSIGSGSGKTASTVLGATTGFLADALVEDVLYAMVTDLKISEKVKKGVIVNVDSEHNMSNGTSGSSKQTTNEQRDRKDYYTRIVSTANKMNLEFSEAKPELVKGLANVMSGML